MPKLLEIFVFLFLLSLAAFGVYTLAHDGTITGNFIKQIFGGSKEIKVFLDPSFDKYLRYTSPFKFWEDRENVRFLVKDSFEDSDVMIKAIKEYVDEQIGYTFDGKLVEVGVGDSKCGGEYNYYDDKTINNILIHELGHVLGKGHSNDSSNVMYPYTKKTYYIDTKILCHNNICSHSVDYTYLRDLISGKSCSDILQIKKDGGIYVD